MAYSTVAVLKKIGLVSNEITPPRDLSGVLNVATSILAVAFSCFFVWVAFFGPPISEVFRGTFVAGIAVLVAQRALSDQVDRINRFDYSVTGPWGQPEVTQLDSGGTLSKLLSPFSGRGDGEAQEPAPATEAPPSTRARPADAARQAELPPSPQRPPDASAAAGGDDDPGSERKRGPLRGVLDFLKRGEPYGADLPGESD